MHCVIGTAGHIDHGKTALIKALTGYDPDRLKEEKERGMTTDLGFAFYGENATIIDVPGHEKFIRHMIAGASTIDLVLLVIAANEGIRPQTIEHLEIIKILGIKRGLVALTKSDTVEKEIQEMVKEEVRDLLKGTVFQDAPIIPTSVVTGEGIGELKRILDQMIKETPAKEDRGYFRMPIDRSFKIKGFGQVVAGTVLSGSCHLEETLEVVPKGFSVRVRRIEIHKKPVEKAELGERAALSLLVGEKEEILRGDVLVEPSALNPTHFLNAFLITIKDNPFPVKNRMAVKLHIGTKEALARVILLDKEELLPGESGYAQIFTEELVVAEVGDRFVIRSFSPPLTIGGGKVLELTERRGKRNDPSFLRHLLLLNSEEKKVQIAEMIRGRGLYPISEKELGRRVGLFFLSEKLNELQKEGKILQVEGYIATDCYREAKEKMEKILHIFHQENPFRKGMRIAELKSRLAKEMAEEVLEKALADLISENRISQEEDFVKIRGFEISLSKEERELMAKVINFLNKTGFSPPSREELKREFWQEKRLEKVLEVLKEKGELVEVENCLFPRETIERAKEILLNLLREKGEITVSEYREKLNTTRRYALPLLNYFDSQGVTIRRGIFRQLRK